MTCPECNGTGQYVGLNEVEPCRACATVKFADGTEIGLKYASEGGELRGVMWPGPESDTAKLASRLAKAIAKRLGYVEVDVVPGDVTGVPTYTAQLQENGVRTAWYVLTRAQVEEQFEHSARLAADALRPSVAQPTHTLRLDNGCLNAGQDLLITSDPDGALAGDWAITRTCDVGDTPLVLKGDTLVDSQGEVVAERRPLAEQAAKLAAEFKSERELWAGCCECGRMWRRAEQRSSCPACGHCNISPASLPADPVAAMARRAGLVDPDLWSASTLGVRRTGRTTSMLLQALVHAENGESVRVVGGRDGWRRLMHEGSRLGDRAGVANEDRQRIRYSNSPRYFADDDAPDVVLTDHTVWDLDGLEGERVRRDFAEVEREFGRRRAKTPTPREISDALRRDKQELAALTRELSDALRRDIHQERGHELGISRTEAKWRFFGSPGGLSPAQFGKAAHEAVEQELAMLGGARSGKTDTFAAAQLEVERSRWLPPRQPKPLLADAVRSTKPLTTSYPVERGPEPSPPIVGVDVNRTPDAAALALVRRNHETKPKTVGEALASEATITTSAYQAPVQLTMSEFAKVVDAFRAAHPPLTVVKFEAETKAAEQAVEAVRDAFDKVVSTAGLPDPSDRWSNPWDHEYRHEIFGAWLPPERPTSTQIQEARGEKLDEFAEQLGVERRSYEPDADLRVACMRILYPPEEREAERVRDSADERLRDCQRKALQDCRRELAELTREALRL